MIVDEIHRMCQAVLLATPPRTRNAAKPHPGRQPESSDRFHVWPHLVKTPREPRWWLPADPTDLDIAAISGTIAHREAKEIDITANPGPRPYVNRCRDARAVPPGVSAA